MSSNLAVRQTVTPSEWETYSRMALTFVSTEFVPKGLRNKKEAVLAAIVSGHELGIGPMQSLKHIAIVDGKPAPSAELLVALVRRAGHSISGEVGDTEVKVKGKRHDNDDEMSVIWTMEMAKTAGLANKNNWKNYPQAMLWSRAVSQLCRMLFADVIAGMGHTPEELGAETDGEGNVIIDVEPISDPFRPEWLKAILELHSEEAVIKTAQSIAPEGVTISRLEQLYEIPSDAVNALQNLLPDEGPDTPAVSEAESTGGGEQTGDGSSSPPVEDAVVIEHPCPVCGSECKPWSDKPQKPKWRCTNTECTGSDGHPWLSFHNNPWKPGGEIEQMKNQASEGTSTREGEEAVESATDSGSAQPSESNPWDAVKKWAKENFVGEPQIFTIGKDVTLEMGVREDGRRFTKADLYKTDASVAEVTLAALQDWKAEADKVAESENAEQKGML